MAGELAGAERWLVGIRPDILDFLIPYFVGRDTVCQVGHEHLL